MSNYRMHALFSIGVNLVLVSIIWIISVLVSNPISYYTISLCLFVGAGFSILPDIDHKDSNASFLLKAFTLLYATFLITRIIEYSTKNLILITYLTTLIIYNLKYGKTGKKHRQHPHTLSFGIVGVVIVGYYFGSFLIGGVGIVSFLSHLYLDKYWKWI